MNLSEYDGKYVRITDTDGNSFSGRAKYGNSEFLECEWGLDEDGIFIEDVIICNSQIESIEEIVPHGSAELWTEHLILRRYRPDDAGQLYECLGADPEMNKYSGWNPYASPEMAQETVRRFIDSYNDERSYSWVMDANGDDVVAGTIGAYDYDNNQIEVGFSVVRAWQGRGFATEALKKVLEYLTENEGICRVTAWCASENTGSRKVLEKSGMQLVSIERGGLAVDDRKYDKMIYEYRRIKQSI
jgi:RimJ/RimL family protein N-acetyltransferase